ncbi:Protein jagunal [Dillenia turbinata]|uniref:Protein jagunal n=1 Tax=Dillenia turbinata TaxID=194707 RepID=A0AAN8VA44_9MAGN
MQQRKSALGRPSGTDGSDFSYRMVVDSRYTKVAKGKSRLSKLFLFQAVTLLLGLSFTFLWMSKEGLVTLPVIGRRNSQAGLLKLYVATSSVAVLLSLAFVIKSNFVSKDTHKEELKSSDGGDDDLNEEDEVVDIDVDLGLRS